MKIIEKIITLLLKKTKYNLFFITIFMFIIFQNATYIPTYSVDPSLTSLSMCSHDVRPTFKAIKPGDMKGAKTKRLSFKADASTTSYLEELHPPHFNQTWKDWYSRLTAAGINTAEIRLEFHKDHGEMPTETKINSNRWISYINEVMKPIEQRTITVMANGESKPIVESMANHIQHNSYTDLQRRQVVLRFLKEMELARKELNAQENPLGFILSDLAWLNDPSDIEGITSEMAIVINDAKALCLDHLIRGVHIYELTNYSAKSIMNLTLKFAETLNLKTKNWLKNRMLIMNGGGKGAHYVGFADDDNNGNLGKNFYRNLKPLVGSFAWGYKFMENKPGDGYDLGINNEFENTDCKNSADDGIPKCSNPKPGITYQQSVDDWTYFLNVTKGLRKLQKLIADNRSTYPDLANVVFVGDSSDTINQMVTKNGPRPSYTALADLFKIANGENGKAFSGKFMMDAFSGIDDHLHKNNTSCPGQNLITVSSASPVTVSPNMAYWSQWPSVPSSDLVTQDKYNLLCQRDNDESIDSE